MASSEAGSLLAFKYLNLMTFLVILWFESLFCCVFFVFLAILKRNRFDILHPLHILGTVVTVETGSLGYIYMSSMLNQDFYNHILVRTGWSSLMYQWEHGGNNCLKLQRSNRHKVL